MSNRGDFTFEDELLVPQDLGSVFAFFADPTNLELLTPNWLRFKILTPLPIQMEEGTQIEYRLRLHGIPLRWKSAITVWEPPNQFVDEQIHGPYRVWIHQHAFTRTDNGTLISDKVQYSVLGGALTNRLLVRKDIARIFAFRKQVMQTVFRPEAPGSS